MTSPDGSTTHLQPAFVASLRRVRLALGAAVAALCVGAVAVAAVSRPHPWVEAAVVVVAVAALGASSAWITSRSMRGIETLVGWVAAGYLLKLAVVAGAVLGAGATGLDDAWVGWWLIAAVVVCAAVEVGVLARTRLSSVDPGGAAPHDAR